MRQSVKGPKWITEWRVGCGLWVEDEVCNISASPPVVSLMTGRGKELEGETVRVVVGSVQGEGRESNLRQKLKQQMQIIYCSMAETYGEI